MSRFKSSNSVPPKFPRLKSFLIRTLQLNFIFMTLFFESSEKSSFSESHIFSRSKFSFRTASQTKEFFSSKSFLFRSSDSSSCRKSVKDSRSAKANRKWKLVMQRLEEEANDRSRNLLQKSGEMIKKNIGEMEEAWTQGRSDFEERSRTLRLRSQSASRALADKSRDISNGLKEKSNAVMKASIFEDASENRDEVLQVETLERVRPSARSRTRTKNSGLNRLSVESPDRNATFQDKVESSDSTTKKPSSDSQPASRTSSSERKGWRSRSLSLLRTLGRRRKKSRSKSPAPGVTFTVVTFSSAFSD